jgi:hypothetical protein
MPEDALGEWRATDVPVTDEEHARGGGRESGRRFVRKSGDGGDGHGFAAEKVDMDGPGGGAGVMLVKGRGKRGDGRGEEPARRG